MIPQFKVRNSFFLSSIFPSALVEWNKLDSDIHNSPSYSIFKKKILNFIRAHRNDVFNVNRPKGLIYLNLFCVCLCHSTEHKFKHSFLETLSYVFVCGFDIKTLNHFFLHHTRVTNERQNFLLKIESISPNIFRKTDTSITSTLLYGDHVFQLNLTPAYSIYPLTTFYPRKGLNRLSLYRLDL